MKNNWVSSRTAKITGLVLAFPATYFFATSVSKYMLGLPFLFDPLEIFYSSREVFQVWNIVSPVIFLGGLSAAILLNIITMFTFSIRDYDGIIKSNISFTPQAFNIFISVFSFALIVMMLWYVFAENFVSR